ncbi:hypothetical protein F53441_2529 [Fusarium austroafricanum]|uniref:BTB domain-containing protein n=1 Tax=Fusarium austroafricanum TaxID=2364996 RepID=A0A8H4KRY1_9HYPO|nr:hypothetical protein F53441_2529 [Fusarium austroafricanum]
MEHVSIDGRRRNKIPVPVLNPTRKLEAEAPPKFRPASPPKSNPWASAKKAPVGSLAGMFPPLPKPQAPWSPVKTPTADMSRASSLSPSKKRSREDTRPAALAPRSASPSSITSSSSRQILEAAAPRAIENLWDCPFGADVVVQSGSLSFRVHRNIVVPQSVWFRENLPPPNLDGTPVTISICFAPETVAHCLRFIYTGKVDICDFDPQEPWNAAHIPRCILAYTTAVYLRMARMANHLLRVVENTSIELGALVQRDPIHRALNCSQWAEFSWHYQSALEIILGGQPQKLMKPMRLAMASILDAVLFWVLRHPLFASELNTSWQRMLQNSMHDIAEYKQLCRSPQIFNSPLPSEFALMQLFEGTKPVKQREPTKSAGTQTEGILSDTDRKKGTAYGLPIVRRERRDSL